MTLNWSVIIQMCARAYDVGLDLSFPTRTKFRDLSELLLSPIISREFPPISSTVTCTLCKKIHISDMGRRLGDRFRQHLRDVKINDEDVSKPVARHFNLPNHSQKHMTVCGLSLHPGNTENHKNTEQKLIFQIGTLSPSEINERFSFL